MRRRIERAFSDKLYLLLGLTWKLLDQQTQGLCLVRVELKYPSRLVQHSVKGSGIESRKHQPMRDHRVFQAEGPVNFKLRLVQAILRNPLRITAEVSHRTDFREELQPGSDPCR